MNSDGFRLLSDGTFLSCNVTPPNLTLTMALKQKENEIVEWAKSLSK
ncbi:hypothetical protein [Cytobacillus praedii]|nr:hypothetical protein [Cytobacillus praedii]